MKQPVAGAGELEIFSHILLLTTYGQQSSCGSFTRKMSDVSNNDVLNFTSRCFLLLLLIAAILWKIKQKYDMYRRRQRLFVELEQMASRPSSQVLVEVDNRAPTPEEVDEAGRWKKRRKQAPSPIALEPCSGNRAAVLSLLVRMPVGDEPYTPPGQSGMLHC